MLAAALEDFGRLPGVEVVTLLPDEPFACAECRYRTIRSRDDESTFRTLAASADFTLVIAPECGDLLETRCRWVEDAGGRSLSPSSAAVRLTGDKLALGRHLHQAKVPTPECQPADPHSSPTLRFPLVCKPRQGAGSQATFLVRNREEWAGCAAKAHAEAWQGDWLVQPLVAGNAVSVAFLVGERRTVPLAPASQELSADGRFRYQGGRLPLAPALAERAVRLGRRAVDTVAGLRGYVGVDLILGECPEGSQDWVIEINPRLTTSYIGLRALAATNLAEAMLRVVQGEDLPDPIWHAGPVHFRPDGAVASQSMHRGE